MNTAIFDWVKTLFLLALAAGVLPFLYHQIELVQAKLGTEKVTKKTKNLAFALNIAKGAVGLAEKIFGDGQAQESSAILALRQRLQENNMSSLFTDDQLKQIIQQAYAVMKSNGELDTLKPSVKDEKVETSEDKNEEAPDNTEAKVEEPVVDDSALSSEAPIVE